MATAAGPAVPASRALRSATCSRMSATSRRDTSPFCAMKIAIARSGSSVCTCTLSVFGSPTTSTESPISSSSGTTFCVSSSSPVTTKFVQ